MQKVEYSDHLVPLRGHDATPGKTTADVRLAKEQLARFVAKAAIGTPSTGGLLTTVPVLKTRRIALDSLEGKIDPNWPPGEPVF